MAFVAMAVALVLPTSCGDDDDDDDCKSCTQEEVYSVAGKQFYQCSSEFFKHFKFNEDGTVSISWGDFGYNKWIINSYSITYTQEKNEVIVKGYENDGTVEYGLAKVTKTDGKLIYWDEYYDALLETNMSLEEVKAEAEKMRNKEYESEVEVEDQEYPYDYEW